MGPPISGGDFTPVRLSLINFQGVDVVLVVALVVLFSVRLNVDRMKKLVANGPVKHPGARCAKNRDMGGRHRLRENPETNDLNKERRFSELSILANVAWIFVAHSVHLDFPSINKRNI